MINLTLVHFKAFEKCHVSTIAKKTTSTLQKASLKRGLEVYKTQSSPEVKQKKTKEKACRNTPDFYVVKTMTRWRDET